MKLKPCLLSLALCFPLFAVAQTVNQEWFKEISDKNERQDLLIQTDSEGYIYVAGTFDSHNNGIDWNLIKLSPAGDTVFNLSFNGEFDGDDFVNAIAIDNSDNVYLTGRFATGESQSSIATFKIESNGEVVWQNISEPAEGINEGLFILTDTAQNVFVGGNLNAEDNSGVFLFRYNFEGTLDWSYELNSSDKETIRGLQPYSNGNFAIACNALRNENWDILLLRISESGTLVFEKYFDGRDAQNDECNDIAIDNNDNAYVTGYSINNESKDFVTIKWNEGGEMEWFALFDEKQKDDNAIGVKVIDDYVIVSGNCLTGETGSEHSDIVTILYDDRGVQLWKQKFNGRDSGDDFAVKLLTNVANNEFILAAKVWFSESGFDTYLLNYTIDGGLIWSINYNDTLSSDNFLSDVSIDFLGNIYAASNAVGSNYVMGEVVKFNQPDKFIPVIKDFLKTLTVGLLDVASDTIVKNVLYEQCATVVDSFFHISYPHLIEECTSRGLNLQEAMNEKIIEFFELPPKDYVEYILKRIWVLGYKRAPLLAVPHYHHFNSTELEDDPKLAYTFEEKNYPLPCLNCSGGTIDNETTESLVTWLTLLGPLPHYYVNGNPLLYITSCTGHLDPSINNRCMVCPPSTAGQIIAGPGSATQNHEIEISLGQFSAFADDLCYGNSTSGSSNITTTQSYYPSQPYVNQLAYARLMRIGTMPYYYKEGWGLPMGEYARIKKVEHPIYDREFYSYITGIHTPHFNDLDFPPTNPNTFRGDVLSICDVNTLFNGLGEHWCRYGLAHGIYRLDRPGINQKPVFFAFPYSQGIWFSQGPDMGIFYGTDGFANQCTTGQIEITEDYFTEQCEFCSIGPQAMSAPITPADCRKYIATTDWTTFYNYWSASVISVGFRTSSNNLPAGLSGTPGLNLHDFTAVTNPTPCTPTGTTLVGSLTVLSNGEYQINKDFSVPPIAPGTSLEIHIVAKFNNGKSIDTCQWVTLIANNPQHPQYPNEPKFSNIVVNIRGDIKDYSSTVTNYLIEIRQ